MASRQPRPPVGPVEPTARWRRWAIAVLLVAACASDDPRGADRATTSTTFASGPGAAPSLSWQRQGDGVETARLDVPFDPRRPSGPSFELFVARHRAEDPSRRIGALFVNPGGPGVGGADLAIFAESSIDPSLLEQFDIIGWDPRGTGRSTPALDCVDDVDTAFAELGETAGADGSIRRPGDELAAGCVDRSGDVLAAVGTNAAARDIDAIRRALGEDRVSYLGFSYGSELGATWATMFPSTVRAAVLDSAEDPRADLLALGLRRAAASEAALTSYLERCGRDPDCSFHNGGSTAEAFDRLLDRLRSEPIDSEPGRPVITEHIALSAVIEAMYSDGFWDQLSDGLAAAQRGDGRGLLQLWDSHVQRLADGTWSNATEARVVIRCMDRAVRPSAAEVDAAMAQFVQVAPRLGRTVAADEVCGSFPAPSDPRVDITGFGAPPIVVIATTGDPVTPLAGSAAMAEALEDGRLVTVTATQHTGYGVNACVDEIVRAYLVELRVPDDGVKCP